MSKRAAGPRWVRLLVDHREDLVGERTRIVAQVRCQMQEFDTDREPKACALDRPTTADRGVRPSTA